MKREKSTIIRFTSFADVAVGHKFEIVKVDTVPKGECFHCAFCGGRGIHFVKLRRDDGGFYKVGKTCLGRVGLELKEEVKKPAPKVAKKATKKKVEVKTKKKVEVAKKQPPKEVSKKKVTKLEKGEMSDDELQDLLSEL